MFHFPEFHPHHDSAILYVFKFLFFQVINDELGSTARICFPRCSVLTSLLDPLPRS